MDLFSQQFTFLHVIYQFLKFKYFHFCPFLPFSIKQTSDVAKLWSESIIIRSKFSKQTSVVGAINMSLHLNISRNQAFVVFTTCPCYQMFSICEWWSPTIFKKLIIISLELSFHLVLFIDRWGIEVKGTVFHQGSPHKSLVCVITIYFKSPDRSILMVWQILVKFLSERFTFIDLLFSDLSLNFTIEFIIKKLIFGVLFQPIFMFDLVKHFIYLYLICFLIYSSIDK